MLIKGLLDLIYNILDLILFVELPAMPISIFEVFNMLFDYLYMGVGVLASFLGSTCLNFLYLLLQIIVSVNLFYMAWSVVFWILRKIPMLGIEE